MEERGDLLDGDGTKSTGPMWSIEIQPYKLQSFLKEYDAHQEGIPLHELAQYREDELKSEYVCTMAGRIEEVVVFLRSLSERIYEQDTVFPYVVENQEQWRFGPAFWYIHGPVIGVKPDGRSEQNIYGTGLLTPLPGNGKIELRIRPRHRFARHLRYWWSRLMQELRVAGIVDGDEAEMPASSASGTMNSNETEIPTPSATCDPTTTHPSQPSRHRAGRRRLVCHDWAFHQRCVIGRQPIDIYDEWKARYIAETGEDPDAGDLNGMHTMMNGIDYRRKNNRNCKTYVTQLCSESENSQKIIF